MEKKMHGIRYLKAKQPEKQSHRNGVEWDNFDGLTLRLKWDIHAKQNKIYLCDGLNCNNGSTEWKLVWHFRTSAKYTPEIELWSTAAFPRALPISG